MNLIRLAIERPIAVIAAMILLVLFGLVSLSQIPIQLAPEVRQPVISVMTNWSSGATPETEREILNRQEDKLAGLEGVQRMVGRARDGRAQVFLEFQPGVDMNRALMLTANRLDGVVGYPEEAGSVDLSTVGNEDSPIAWFMLQRLEGNDSPIHEFGDFAEDVIRDRLERVNGVARANVYGGSQRELRVTISPEAMARYRVTIPDLVRALRAASLSVSAGDVEEGKRHYLVRVEGELITEDKVRSVVVRSLPVSDDGGIARITIGDLAEVSFAYKEPDSSIRSNGIAVLAINAMRESGSNVIDTMAHIREQVDRLNDSELSSRGLILSQVYDETIYINSAIGLVRQNIWLGGILAACVLYVFLRSGQATLIIGLSIPASIIGTFIAMAALGRSLNVISLAGIAFSVGMVVDAAIVVIENIYRLSAQGMKRADAALEGARQVWGAIFVSALTTALVFLPLLLIDLEIGQLFRDIAVAISVSVMLSLLVAMTLIPALANRIGTGNHIGASGDVPVEGRKKLPGLDRLGSFCHRMIMSVVRLVTRRSALGSLSVIGIIGACGLSAWLLVPKLEYLPSGNPNLVIGFILPPAGYNLDTVKTIANRVENVMSPYWPTQQEDQDRVGAKPDGRPIVKQSFFVALRSLIIVGAKAMDPARIGELIPILSRPVFQEPGTFGIMKQPSLFGRSVGGSRSIELQITGPNLDTILALSRRAFGLVSSVLPREQGNQYRPRPGLSLGSPELRIIPDRTALNNNRMNVRDLAQTVDTLNDGMRIAEITVDGDRLDLTLAGSDSWAALTQDIEALPVATPDGHILPLSSLASIVKTAGPTEIRHIDRERAVTIEITPAAYLPLEAAIDIMRDQILLPLQAEGLPPGVNIRLSGTADKLSQSWDAMIVQFMLAFVVIYLVMAVLFESLLLPLVICLTVPAAIAGGVWGLAFLNLFVDHKLDMLTLLGFVILLGIIVNNAILIVHQSLICAKQEGVLPQEAILTATSDRIRPIFMSTLTSLFGMMPLALFPGAGSELYRGLGAVVLGGLAVSAILTLAILPPLLSLAMKARIVGGSVLQKELLLYARKAKTTLIGRHKGKES